MAATPREARATAPVALNADAGVTPIVAVDCEMVGVGPDGARSELARCAPTTTDGGSGPSKSEHTCGAKTTFTSIHSMVISCSSTFVT